MTERQPAGDVTAMLVEWEHGDAEALERVVPLVYEELRRVARAHLRGERAGHTLQTTGLVHEAYLKLVGLHDVSFKSRTHLLAMLARLMRQILVDHARKRRARKRGGAATMVGLDNVQAAAAAVSPVDVLALDEALTELASLEARLCRVVELKFFAGLNIDETAEALGVSPATVERDWVTAKAWLHQRLSMPR